MIFQMVIARSRQDASGMKEFPFERSPPALVELLSHLGIGVVLKQLIKQRNGLGSSVTPTTDGKSERLGGPALQAYLSSNHLLLQQGHILNRQTHHAFAVPIRGACIMPHPGEIFDQVSNGLAFECEQSALFRFILL